jgi:transposase
MAQKAWGLTDEQMEGMHVHHHPAQSEGGRNVPEHLYVCSPSMHQHGWHNDEFFLLKAGSNSGNRHGPRGRPPKKTEPTERDKLVYSLRKEGLSSTGVAEKLGISRQMAKDSYKQCVQFGYPKLPNPRTGPPKGSAGQPLTEETKEKIRAARANQTFTEETQRKKSEKMREICKERTWSRKKKC